MTEKEIKLLGFKREDSLDSNEEFYYYTYKVANGFEFISCANDETKDDEWFIDFFNSDPVIRFTEFGELQSLLNFVEKKIVKK